MPSLYNFNQVELLGFFLVLVRISSFVVTWPIFGSRLLPAPIKVLFALCLTLVIFPTVSSDTVNTNLDDMWIIWMTVKEAFIGLSIGFLSRMFLYSISIAGQIISVSMGLSGVQLFNPSMGGNSTAIDQFQVLLVSLLFLALNGHHMFLGALVKSFEMVPVSAQFVSVAGFESIGDIVNSIMIIGVKLSAPVLVAITIMNVVMAIIGRAVPQINVLITSLPVNILVGFLVLIFSLPVFLGQVDGLIEFSATNLFKMLKSY